MKLTDTATAATERVLSDECLPTVVTVQTRGLRDEGLFETEAPAVGITRALLIDAYGSERAS